MSGYDVARALRHRKGKGHLELIANLLYRALAELEQRDTPASMP